MPILETKKEPNRETIEINVADKAIPTSNKTLSVNLLDDELSNVLQQAYPSCVYSMKMLQDKKLQDSHPYYMKDCMLKRYVSDNRQVFETTVIPFGLTT